MKSQMLSQLVQDPNIEQLLRNLAVSKKNWPEIMSEIHQLTSTTTAGDAKNALIQSAMKLLSYEKVEAEGTKLPTSDELSKAQEFLQKQPTAPISASKTDSSKQFGRLLKIVFKKLLAEEDMALIGHLSYLPFTSGFEVDRGNMNQVLEDLLLFVQQAAERHDGLWYLLAIKVALCLLEEESLVQGAKVPPIPPTSLPPLLSSASMLDTEDISAMATAMQSLEHKKLFDDIPRPFPLYGSLGKSGRTEIGGLHVGGVANFTLPVADCRFAYYEVALQYRGKEEPGVRLGWSFRSASVESVDSLGEGDASFVLDLQAKRFLHNAGMRAILGKKKEDKEREEETEESISKTADDIFGGLFGEDAEEGGERQDKEEGEVKDSKEGNEDGKMTLESSVDEKAAEKGSESASPVADKVAKEYGEALLSPTGESLPFSVSSGTVIVCVLDLHTGQMHFYCNEAYIGCAPCTVPVEKIREIIPCYSIGNTLTALDVNTGNKAFQHINSVCKHLASLNTETKAEELKESVNRYMKEKARKSSCLLLPSHSSSNSESNSSSSSTAGYVYVPHLVTAENTKTLTIELSLCVQYSKVSAEVEEYSVLTCGSSLPSTFPVLDCPTDRGGRLSVTSTGCLCFEVSGSEKFQSKVGLIKPSVWHQLAVVYTYHRSTEKATVHVYLNGQLAQQADLVNKKAGKVGKVLPRSLFIHYSNMSSASVYSLSLCDVRLWISARSQEKIVANMHRSKIFGNEADLVFYMPMNEGWGDRLHYIYGSNGSRRVDRVQITGTYIWKDVDDCISAVPTLNSSLQCTDRIIASDREEIEVLRAESSLFLDDVNMHFLASLITPLLIKYSSSCAKFTRSYLADRNVHALSSSKQTLIFLHSIPAIKAIISPTPIFFMMTVSILRHYTSIIDKNKLVGSKASLYLSCLLTILKLLNVNIMAYTASPNTFSTSNNSQLENVKQELFTQLLLLLRGFPDISPGLSHKIEAIQTGIVGTLAERLDFFVDDIDAQYSLLKTLLQYSLSRNEVQSDNSPSDERVFNKKLKLLSLDLLGIISSLPTPAMNLLLNKLLSTLSSQQTLSRWFSPTLKPVGKIEQKKGLKACVSIEAYVGAVVQRGKDWEYGEEDGRDLGMVLDVRNWGEQRNCSVVVQWKNGKIEEYRYGAAETIEGLGSSEGAKLIYDVEILHEHASKKIREDVVEKADGKESESSSRPLLYAPFDVLQALLEVKERVAITRRNVIQYMKENSTNEWQTLRKISKPIHVVMKEISTLQLCSLYIEYSNIHSPLTAATKSTISHILSRSVAQNNLAPTEAMSILLDMLLKYLFASIGNQSLGQDALQLIQAIQYQLCNESSDVAEQSALTCAYQAQDYKIQFTSNQSAYLWDWKLGQWLRDDSKPAAVSAAVSREQHVLTSLTVNENELHPYLQLRRRSKFLDILCTGQREWYTMHCNEPMQSNAGIYTWYVKLKSFADRRSHFMVGMCCEKKHTDDFLGIDRDSMGISQGFDFYFNGRKHRSNYDRVRFGNGTVIQVTYNSDEPSVQFIALTNDNDIYKRTIDKETLECIQGKTFYPALSLYSSGDCIAFVTDDDDIAYFEARVVLLLSAEVANEKKVTKKSQTISFGCPNDCVASYVHSYTEMMKKVFTGSHIVKLLQNKQDGIVGTYLNLLAAMHWWSFPSLKQSDKTVRNMFDLLSLLQIQSGSHLTDDIASREKLLFVSYHLSSLLITNIARYIHLLFRYDQILVLNQAISTAVYSQSKVRSPSSASVTCVKESVLKHMSSKLFRHGLRLSGKETNLISIDQSSKGWDYFVQWLCLHDRQHRITQNAFSLTDSLFCMKGAIVTASYHSGLSSIMLKLQSLLENKLTMASTSSEEILKVLKSTRLPYFLSHFTSLLVFVSSLVNDLQSSGNSNEYVREHFGMIFSKAILFNSCFTERNFDKPGQSFDAYLQQLQMDTVLMATADSTIAEVVKMMKSLIAAPNALICMADVAKGVMTISNMRREGLKVMHSMIETLSSDIGGGLKSIFIEDARKILKGKPVMSVQALSNPLFPLKDDLKFLSADWHYLDQLNCSNRQQVQEVQAAFNSLMSSLAAELSSNCEAGSEYQLLLVDSLAVRIHAIDHELLARMNIFFTIQELLEELTRPSLSLGSENIRGDDFQPTLSNSAKKRNNMVASAMKLFIFLALQVALDQDNQSNSRILTASMRQLSKNRPYLELTKVKSGPATLSKAVFDIIYSLLRDIINMSKKLKSKNSASDSQQSSTAPQKEALINDAEQQVVMEESIALLLCVSRHAECSKILVKSKWFQLLLEVSAYGSGLSRSNSMILLADLLSQASVQDLSFSLPMTEEIFSGPHHSEEALYNILYLLGDAAISMESKPGNAKEERQANTAFISEGIALINKLLSVPAWKDDAMAALEYALGGTEISSLTYSNCGIRPLFGTLLVVAGYWERTYRGNYVLYKPGEGTEEHIGVIQSLSEGDNKALISGFRVASLIRLDEGAKGKEIEINSAYIASQSFSSIEKYSSDPKRLSMSIWSKITSMYSILIKNIFQAHTASIPSDQNIFITKVATFACLKCLSIAFDDPVLSQQILLQSFDSYSSCAGFAHSLLEFGSKPCVYGGLNNIEMFENILGSVFHHYRVISRIEESKELADKDEKRVESNQESSPGKEVEIAESKQDEEPVMVEHTDIKDADESPYPAEIVESLAAMGFSKESSILALSACHGDVEEALHYILTNTAALEEMVAHRAALRSGETHTLSESKSMPERPIDSSSNFHYDGSKRTLLPLFAEPRYDAERLACVFPGDDIAVFEEKVVDGFTWYKVQYSDFDESNMQASYSEEMLNVFVWAPQYIDDEQVVQPGSCMNDIEQDLADPPCETIKVDKYYRIIGANGATVRRGIETSSSEIMTINQGDFVHAHAETFNSDGTCRLQVDYPMKGWISKIFGLVELLEPDDSLLSSIQEFESTYTEVVASDSSGNKEAEIRSQLVNLEDNFELITGSDPFNKEDRYFGQMQGLCFTYFRPRDSINKEADYSSKYFKISNFKSNLLDSAATAKIDLDRYTYCITPLYCLYARKLALQLLLKIGVKEAERVNLVQMLDLSSDSSGDVVSSLVELLRFTLFRGEPYSILGIESSQLHSVSGIAASTSNVSIEEILFTTIARLVNDNLFPSSLRSDFEVKLRVIVLENLVYACSSKYSDHSWVDSSYTDDTDEEIPKLPNVHVIIWVTKLFIAIQSVDSLLTLLESLILSLKASSMSFKTIVLKILSSLLDAFRLWKLSEEQQSKVSNIVTSVPMTRFKKFGVKRLWQEMEDSPAFSRFFQSYVDFMGQLELFRQHCSVSTSPNRLPSSPTSEIGTISFCQPESHIKLLPAKELAGSWTLEFWMRRKRYFTDEFEGDIKPASTVAKSDDSSAGGRLGFSTLMQLLLGTARQNIEARKDKDGVIATTETSKELAQAERAKFLHPSYLLSSSKFFIKIQKGGRLLDEIEDPLQDNEFVANEAMCLSIGQNGSDQEKVFDFLMPRDSWFHLALTHDSNAGFVTLFVDGKEKDCQQCSISLPLHCIGSSKPFESFSGEIAEMRVWSYARSGGEIARDMSKDVVGYPLLLSYLSFERNNDLLVNDRAGYFTKSKAIHCHYLSTDIAQKQSKLVHPMDGESIHVVDKQQELTGVINMAGQNLVGPLSKGLQEILSLSYCTRLVGDEGNKVKEVNGLLQWCDRGVKVSVSGNVRENGSLELVSDGKVTLGQPEQLSWLRSFKFVANMRNGNLEGSVEMLVDAETAPPVSPGLMHLDTTCLPAEITQKSINGQCLLTLQDVADGQYIAYFEISAYKPWFAELDTVESFPYGVTSNEGSLWFEWKVNSNAGNIAFGFCSSTALTHPDASVDANECTWTYSTSGQASHGANLYLCETADEGDVVSAQINTDKGYIRFYKNYEVVVTFDAIYEHSSLRLDKENAAESGIRPFVSLCCAGDSVSSLPHRKGPIEILFPEADPLERGKFLCSLEKGKFSGYGLLGFQKNSSWWFGMYSDDDPTGYHVQIENINSKEIILTAVRQYVNGQFETFSLESISEVALRLVEAFKTFRAERNAIEGSLFSSLSLSVPPFVEDIPVPPSVDEALVADRMSVEGSEDLQVTIFSNGHRAIYNVKSTSIIRIICEAFALANEIPVDSYTFKNNEVALDLDSTFQQLSLANNATISATARVVLGNFREADDLVEKHFPSSTAKYIVQIMYEPGATVRNGIEIETSSALSTLNYRETCEAFQHAFTSEGIKRYRTGEGWISDRLRGGSEAKVVRMLQEKLDTQNTFKIVREDGVKLRAKASLNSDDLGIIPKDIVITVSDRRLVHNGEGIPDESTLVKRLHVVSPEEYRGWISEKTHLVEPVQTEEELQRGQNQLMKLELQRRIKIRALRKAKLALLESDKKYKKATSVKASLSLSQETLFLWKKNKYSEGLSISADYQTVSCLDSSGGRCLVLGSTGFTQGIHYWEVTVKSTSWGSVFIGVASDEGSGWNGLGFINYRATQAFGSETLYGTYYGVNDKIGVLLNMENGTLTFFKDGDDFNVGHVRVVDMGVAYHNVRKLTGRQSTAPMLYPCIGMKAHGDELSIKNCHWHSLPGRSSEQIMEDILQHYQLVYAWQGSYNGDSAMAWDEKVLEKMYFDYQHSVQSTSFPTTSRAGLDVNIDCAPNALSRCLDADTISAFNLSIGCKVSTAYGVATILGVTDSTRIWYSCERNGQKAWYWLVEEMKELLVTAAIQREDKSDTSSLPLFPQESVTINSIICYEDYRHAVVYSHWKLEEDVLLVYYINKMANEFDQDPAKFSYQQLQTLCNAVLADKVLRKKSKVEIKVRFAAICTFNVAMGKLLPYIDLNDADARKTISHVSLENIQDFGRNPTFLQSSMSKYYQSMKEIVFTMTKMRFWQHAVDETTVSTSAPADEYERPDEIKEVSINRIQARNAIKQKEHKLSAWTERLRVSVFGQLFETLSGWDARSLRRSYVHMQDAGQARCFFVKCQGEGVDDQGGPYRAVFQQAFEEAMQLLDLCLPVPNAQAEIGSNRDKMWWNLQSPATAKHIEHMGRLVGIAVRHKVLLPINFAAWIWKALAGEELTIDEIKQIDLSYINSLEAVAEMISAGQQESAEELLAQALYQNNHSLPLSSHTSQSLVNQLLRACPVHDVLALIHYLRLHSQDQLLESFFAGLSDVLPVELFSLFTAQELERVFCGEIEVDLSLLKKVTVYEAVSPDEAHIQYFWQALEAMTGEERAQFVNFCSGRSRLPSSASAFLMPLKLSTANGQGDPDKYLPTARTCFFTLAVPKYSSFEVCLAKLKYAVQNTELMDADFVDRRGNAAWDNLA